MSPNVFQSQLERIRREWRNAFGEEKTSLLWKNVSRFTDEFMIEATDEFLANRRSAPVVNDFLEYESVFKKRQTERRYRESDFNLLSYMDRLANFSPNKEFAKKCVKTLGLYLDKKIPFVEFISAMARAIQGLSHLECECDHGIFIATNKNGARFAFSCSKCAAGEIQRALPQWEEVFHGSKYVIQDIC